MAGVKQENLIQNLINLEAKEGQTKIKDNVTNIEPDVLLSMFEKEEEVNKYLQFVFPRKVNINFTSVISIPTFFTFVATDELANPSYFHCLIIYEKMDEETLLNFDFKTLLEQKKLANKKKNKPRTRLPGMNMVGGRK
jgi:hypothetical protein